MEDFGLEFAPRRQCSRGPSVAATRRDYQGSQPEPGAFSLRLAMHDLGVRIFERFAGRPSSSGTVKNQGGCVQARARVSDKHTEMRDRKRKIRNKMECDTESRDLLDNHTAEPLFTFRGRRCRSGAAPANAGWQISEAGSPRAFRQPAQLSSF